MREFYLDISDSAFIKGSIIKGNIIRSHSRDTYIITEVIGDNYFKRILRFFKINLRYNQIKVKLYFKKYN